MQKLILGLFALLCLSTSCTTKVAHELSLCDEAKFDSIIDGKQVQLHTLKNEAGMTMQVTNYGARVVTLFVPNRENTYDDVVLGLPTLADYCDASGERFLGAVVGRFANRIANGQFAIEGKSYQLSTYNNGQCLHGGIKGLDRVVWTVDSLTTSAIYFSYLSPDGEEGFPGTLDIKMTYELTDDNIFRVTYGATTDKATPVNISHHSFFNLKGAGNGEINDHQLLINAEGYLPVNSVLIPLGYVASVENTPFDFRTLMPIGSRVNSEDAQLAAGSGYDHCFVLNRKSSNGLEFAARVVEPLTGKSMEVWTTEPAIQFYGGNFFDGSEIGKNGKAYAYRGSFALETQQYPDAVNQKAFPSPILLPGQTYSHVCEYRFSVLK